MSGVVTAKSLLHMTLPLCIFNWFPTFLDRNVAPEISKKVIDLVKKVIEEHDETLEVDNPRDFIDAMLIEMKR